MLLDTDKIRAALHAASGTEVIVDLGVVDRAEWAMRIAPFPPALITGKACTLCGSQLLFTRRAGAGGTPASSGGRTAELPPPTLMACWLTCGLWKPLQAGAALPDKRGWFERTLDKLIRAEYLGEYHPASQLDAAPVYQGRVVAKVARWGGQLNVSMTESRSGGAGILAQFPVSAFARIRQALAAFAAAQQAMSTERSLPSKFGESSTEVLKRSVLAPADVYSMAEALGTRCPKCGYQRIGADINPGYECPKCGINDAKYRNKYPPAEPADAGLSRATAGAKSRTTAILLSLLLGGGSAPINPIADSKVEAFFTLHSDRFFSGRYWRLLRLFCSYLERWGSNKGATRGSWCS